MCQNHPWEFGVYLRYCKNLRFTQTPDYNYLITLFRGCLRRHDYAEDYVFDWNRAKKDNTNISLYSVSNSPSNHKGKNVLDGKKSADIPSRSSPSRKLLDAENNPNNTRLQRRRYSQSLPNSLGHSIEEKGERIS